MHSIEKASDRVRQAKEMAARNGIPDFVVNARTDVLLHGGTLDDVIERGKAYLAAGAFSVFVWGGTARGGLSREEVKLLTKAFHGRLKVMMTMTANGLSVQEVAQIGVSRCSIGPFLQFAAKDSVTEAAAGYLRTGNA
jgi:2-methylisocitrate lyase-like PEP mutase family enzyme